MNTVTWYEAVAYCNWLSAKEGLAEGKWCYLKNAAGQYAHGMKLAPDYLQRTGYRLPTEAEWEYACRAGADTAYGFGEPADLLGKYAWFAGSSPSKSQPAGKLRPNDLGLLDMHGNAGEWSQGRFKEIRNIGDKEDRIIEDRADILSIREADGRVLGGGTFFLSAVLVRSANRGRNAPSNRNGLVGFRAARTFRRASLRLYRAPEAGRRCCRPIHQPSSPNWPGSPKLP